jgi:hypothetical protein
MAYGKLFGGPVTQHEGYAVTGKAPQDETFGVLQHNHKDRPNPEPKIGRKRHWRLFRRAPLPFRTTRRHTQLSHR